MKEKFRELSASEITETAIMLLELRHCKAWRQANIPFRRRANQIKYSIPDVMGHNKSTGLMVGCEVKKIGDVLSSTQIEFLTELHNSGGIAMVAHQVRGHVELTPFVDYYIKETKKP